MQNKANAPVVLRSTRFPGAWCWRRFAALGPDACAASSVCACTHTHARTHARARAHTHTHTGAVVAAQGPRFVCFYHGWGDETRVEPVTPMLTSELVCPEVASDGKYRVVVPKVYEDDPENPDAEGNPGKKEVPQEVPPPYPREGWKKYNDEQMDLKDQMSLEFEELQRREREEAEEARKAAEAEAVNSET